ncbi:Aldehyde dehydrogenase [Labilithrix luteola]|uniref:Aldehyde dehydrogenase n=2 Tax=Labilithrix luteola TaxID=1391654 RepID=A0A0K1QFU2_9BACT|nr:Aldehyde dehydrogenase [Labilithrix luteola]
MVENVRSAENGSSSSSASSASADAGRGAHAELSALLGRLKAAQRKSGAPDYDTRIDHLDKLEKALLARKEDFVKAIGMDFGTRSRHETLAAEVMVVVNEIKHARAHLHEWMETESREIGWTFLPARGEVLMQPVGVVGIISPWNYPLQLALAPLVGALAAGNRVMLKPSELASDTAEMTKTLISEIFEPDHVAVVTGGVDVADAFSRLPFDHLVFTGSTRLGKIVMKAAAENLTPVTLELGGKSPAIVGDGYAIAQAAQKVMFGKCLNAGQTCVAPDYVLLPKGRADAFVEECKKAFAEMYPLIGSNPDYTAIINDRHYDRLQSYLEDARDRGAKLIELNHKNETLDPNARKMAPVLVLHAKEDMLLMQEEIFGPILPIKTYETLDEAIAYVNDHPRPLSLYFFEHDQKAIDKVLRETMSGGVGINETMLHVAQSDLPFGGIGPSGMGHYHAREGFETFTKKKPVFYQSRINSTSLLKPPFGSRIDFVLKMLLGK